MITGESRPVARGEGDRVVAGTVATDSALRVRVDRVGEDTALAGIQRLVAEAQSSRSRAQALADRAAAALFYVATAAAAVTFVVWALLGELGDADHPDRHRARDLVPARARPGDPPGDRHRHLAGRRCRRAGPGPAVARAHAPRRHRAVRQDGHADPRRARGGRHGRGRRRRRRAARARCRGGGAERAPARPRDRRRRARPQRPDPRRRGLPRAARARRRGAGRRDARWRSAALRCCASWASSPRRSSTARSTAGGRAARRCCTSSATGRSPERSPSRTRCGPSRARRSTGCTGAAYGWR